MDYNNQNYQGQGMGYQQPYVQPSQQYQYNSTPTQQCNMFQQPQYQQPQMNNPELVHCSACGNMIYRYAASCPYCGKPVERIVKSTPFLDFICIICLVASALMYMNMQLAPIGFLIALFWLIVYFLLYEKYKKKPEYDASKLKQSMIAIAVLFFVNIGFGFVIVF